MCSNVAKAHARIPSFSLFVSHSLFLLLARPRPLPLLVYSFGWIFHLAISIAANVFIFCTSKSLQLPSVDGVDNNNTTGLLRVFFLRVTLFDVFVIVHFKYFDFV